ncbi:MAG: hypothetical protein IJA78_00390 [Clostridia bacterium]|nr:hypothetical protein [Clostridia bacterium]
MNRIFSFLLCISLLPLLLSCGKAQAASDAKQGEQTDFLASLTFLGDSTTAHMAARAAVTPAQIWAAKNRYLNLDHRITYATIVAPDTGAEETIATVAARIKPRYLVITLGIDYGVYYYRNDLSKFRFYYEKLLDAISAASPETVLVLQSVFPVTAASTAITNEMIDRANGEIRAIAAARGLVYVDANAVLKNEDGYLADRFCNSEDGLHLTAKAYEQILENLKRYETAIKESV